MCINVYYGHFQLFWTSYTCFSFPHNDIQFHLCCWPQEGAHGSYLFLILFRFDTCSLILKHIAGSVLNLRSETSLSV